MALTWVLKGWLVNGINLGTQRSPLKPNKRGITSFVFHGKKERAPLLCCIFAHPRSGDLSARTSPEEQASEAAPSPRLCTRGVEERSSFWGTHLRDCSLRTTTSSTSRSRLCTANTCTTSSLIGYIEQARLAMSGNGASGSFGTGPASGYFLNLMFMFIVFVTSTLNHALNFIYKNVMIYALIFGIKMNPNWPLIPTAASLLGHGSHKRSDSSML